MNTCDTCWRYTHPRTKDPEKNGYNGSCALIQADHKPTPVDGVSIYEYYSEFVTLSVGPKFGCIHWSCSAEYDADERLARYMNDKLTAEQRIAEELALRENKL